MRPATKYISGPALYFLLVACLLALFFELWRAILLIRLWDLAATIPLKVLLGSFLVGWRFDFVIAAYFAFPLYAIGIIPMLEVSRRRLARWISFGLLIALTAVAFFLHLVDLEFFAFFSSRLNGMALSWQDTPGMMLSMVWEMYPIVTYLLLYAAVLALFIAILYWLQRKLLVQRKPSPVWVNLLYIPIVSAILLIGARGRIQVKSPIRTGVAYFSEYDFANQLALNPTFTFWRDAIYDARDKQELEKMLARIDCPGSVSIVHRLLGMADSLNPDTNIKICRQVRFTPPNDNPPNVILILMESYGSTKLGALDNRFPHDLSPCFDSLAEQGLLFTNFYSAGMHTYTGVFSSFCGYPHHFTELIMKQVRGQAHFWSIASILRDHGYQTHFFLTHDPHFDNMQGFVMSNGIMKTHSELDFDPEDRIGTWGVPDHAMFDKAFQRLRNLYPRKFFAMLLTTSNHGPWQVPDVPFERLGTEVERSNELNAFKYSDWALGRFVRQIESDTCFDNTVVLITADNGTPYHRTLDLDLTQFAVPLLILDTDRILPAGKRINRLGSQLDILATVMGLVRLDYDDYSFGHDLLDTTSHLTDFAHFSEWFKIGYIEGDYYLIHRLRGERNSLYRVDDCSVNLIDSLPDLAHEYDRKARAIFRTAYYNMRRELLHTEPLADGLP